MKLPSSPLPARFSRVLAASTLAAAAFAPVGLAQQQLLMGGPDTLIRRALPVASTFEIVGACGGIVESMVGVGELTYIGDISGILYVHDPLAGVGYSFNTTNDAVALSSDGQRLFVGGSDGTVESYDLATEQLLAIWQAPTGLRALTRVGDELFAAGDSGVVSVASLQGTGVFSTVGAAGMPVTAMATDGQTLFLGAADGTVQRMDVASRSITGSLQAGTDVTALASHMGHLLASSQNGTLLRLDPLDGTVLDSHQVGSSIRALALTEDAAPGISYCYGVQCPCGNDDPLSGCTNSTGRGAHLGVAGTNRVSADDLALFVTGAPAHTTTILFMGNGFGSGALGNGLLCIGGTVGLQRFGAGQTNSFGALVVDGVAQHAATHFSNTFQITAGSSWHFQAWYRDIGGPCGAVSNVSNSTIIDFSL